MEFSEAKSGQRVRYTGRHAANGLTAVVVRAVKSRKVITIDWEDAPEPLSLGLFDADPANLTVVAELDDAKHEASL